MNKIIAKPCICEKCGSKNAEILRFCRSGESLLKLRVYASRIWCADCGWEVKRLYKKENFVFDKDA